MKTRFFTLLMTLFVFVWSVKADEIQGFTITMSRNGGEFENVSFSAEGESDIDFSEDPTTSLIIKKIEAHADGTVSNVVFSATMYKTANGLRPDDGWRSFDLVDRHGGKWVLDLGDGVDLIDEEMGGSPRTFQFYLKGQDGSGNDIYCNNGGQDYKILFSKSGTSLPIKNLILTVRLNGGEAFTQEIPAEGFPVVDLTDEQTTSLIIEKIEVQAIESVSDVSFLGTMYSTNSGSSGDEWREYNMEYKSNGRWMLYFGEGVELVEEDWIGQNKTKTFEFYVKAKDYFGNDTFYNNGGEDYKVTFTTGEGGGQKIQFVKGRVAELTLRFNDALYGYAFNDDGSRDPIDQPGQLTSLAIDQFALWFYVADGVNVNDVSLQYRVYEEGQEPEGGWSRIDATHLDKDGGNKMFCYAENVDINVTSGLEPNRVYILEVNYQVVVGEEYFFLGKNKESSKFRFTLTENVVQDEIYSVILTLKHNGGEPYEVYFEHENMPTLNLEGQTTSLKIMKAEVWTSEGVQSVNVVGTMYNTENGGPTGGDEWRSMPLTQSDNGYWLLDFDKEGYEIVEDEWINNDKSKTFQFYVTAVDRQENGIIYDNEGQDYKVSFTTGSGSGGDGILSMTLTVSCDGEVFTESFPSEGWEIHAIEGLVSSIKVMRVEVETSESLTYVGFCSTIYDTADGWQHDDTAWDWIPMDNQGGGHWVLDWGEGRECVASEWLDQNVTKTLEFFADGGDANGNKYKYANGTSDYGYDNNYKVTFTPGVDPDGISLVSASKENGATYNLAGQRVRKDYKGIVITNGRKVLIK
ncbi:MAG: hypothetical protein IJK51_09140 [Bacteroidaceae bacterium]|nr:hypothetical protein [Bacteroidaceae bacterium]